METSKSMFMIAVRDSTGAALAPSRALLVGEAGTRELSPGDGERWSIPISELVVGRQQLRVELPNRPELRLLLANKRSRGAGLGF
ncbi:MAG TPA: hypothetical protein VK034_08490, partial [Enhygromyxa sp.]|nr:hypothetical protein [Enhygromyxa sp.]